MCTWLSQQMAQSICCMLHSHQPQVQDFTDTSASSQSSDIAVYPMSTCCVVSSVQKAPPTCHLHILFLCAYLKDGMQLLLCVWLRRDDQQAIQEIYGNAMGRPAYSQACCLSQCNAAAGCRELIGQSYVDPGAATSLFYHTALQLGSGAGTMLYNP